MLKKRLLINLWHWEYTPFLAEESGSIERTYQRKRQSTGGRCIVQLPIYRVLDVAHLCQSNKVQSTLAEFENLADKVFASEPAVTEDILGMQTLVNPCSF